MDDPLHRALSNILPLIWILSNIRDYFQLHYMTCRFLSIWHMLRLGTAPLNGFLNVIDDTRDGSCSCGHASETVQHYLLDCERYTAQRTALATSVRAQVPTFACLSVPRLLGDPDRLSTAQLDRIFVAVTSFITATERFSDLIIPEGRPPD